MALIGKVPGGNGLVVAGQPPVRVEIPAIYNASAISMRFINAAEPAANGANNAVVKVWRTTVSTNPPDNDLYDILEIPPGGNVDLDCVTPGKAEYLFFATVKGTVTYRVDGVFDEEDVMIVGVLSRGNLDTIQKLQVPLTSIGGTVSIHVLNRNDYAADGSKDAKIEVYISENPTAPTPADLIDKTTLGSYGGTMDRECVNVSAGEYIYLKSNIAGVNYSVTHILERKP